METLEELVKTFWGTPDSLDSVVKINGEEYLARLYLVYGNIRIDLLKLHKVIDFPLEAHNAKG